MSTTRAKKTEKSVGVVKKRIEPRTHHGHTPDDSAQKARKTTYPSGHLGDDASVLLMVLKQEKINRVYWIFK